MKAIIKKNRITVSRCRECDGGSLDAREWQNCNKICVNCGAHDKIDVATAVFRDGYYWEICSLRMPKPELISRLVCEIFCKTPHNPVFIEIFNEDVESFQTANGSFRIERQNNLLTVLGIRRQSQKKVQ